MQRVRAFKPISHLLALCVIVPEATRLPRVLVAGSRAGLHSTTEGVRLPRMLALAPLVQGQYVARSRPGYPSAQH